MSDPVQVGVRSSLGKIIEELERIRDMARETGEAFKETGDGVADGVQENTKQTTTFLEDLRRLTGRVADSMRRDFKALISINAIGDALKLSNQFRENVRESVVLSDTIRKLGTTFGLTGDQFVKFQARMTKGLGEIGLSSDVAARALEGLSETQVRGDQNLIAYSRTAGMLASVGREQGSEGDIARMLAGVTQARGGNINDPKQLEALAESIRRVLVQTGAQPTETLRAMESIFKAMPEDMRKAISSSGLTSLATAAAVGGPNSTKFLEEYLGKSPIARMAFEAQGGKGIFTNDGIDIEKFRAFAKDITGRVGGDPRLAAQTLGLTEDAAEGFVRLYESLDKVADAQQRVARTTGSLSEQYRASLTLGEAFRSNINRVKSALAEPLATVTQKATDLLSRASESNLGAGAVALGGGALAAMLAGGGLRGVGGGLAGLAGTAARMKGAEELLGAKTVPVYVVNASEIGGGGIGGALSGVAGAGGAAAAGGKLATILSFLGKAGMVGAAGAAGATIGTLVAPIIDEVLAKHTTETTPEGFEGDVIERLMFKASKFFGGESARGLEDSARARNAVNVEPPSQQRAAASEQLRAPATPQKIVVELASPQLKASVQPTRGASN